jgi:hypothetical protein
LRRFRDIRRSYALNGAYGRADECGTTAVFRHRGTRPGSDLLTRPNGRPSNRGKRLQRQRVGYARSVPEGLSSSANRGIHSGLDGGVGARLSRGLWPPDAEHFVESAPCGTDFHSGIDRRCLRSVRVSGPIDTNI